MRTNDSNEMAIERWPWDDVRRYKALARDFGTVDSSSGQTCTYALESVDDDGEKRMICFNDGMVDM